MQPDQQLQSSPLETLVVQQLAQMLRQERALQERYRRLGSTRRSGEDVYSFTNDLSKFDQRAKRLFRMMEAMEGC